MLIISLSSARRGQLAHYHPFWQIAGKKQEGKPKNPRRPELAKPSLALNRQARYAGMVTRRCCGGGGFRDHAGRKLLLVGRPVAELKR